MKKTLFFLAAALTFSLAANAQSVFSEDFESVTVSSQTGLGELPAGWTLYEDNLTNYSSSQGSFTVFGKSWKVYDMDGWGKLAISITYTMEGTACDRWLITPAITIPDEGDYKLVFNQLASPYNEHMSVMVSTTNTEKASFTQTLIDNELLTAGASTRLLDLSSFTGQTIYIAFVAQTADGMYIGVDDVQVKVVAPDNMAALAATTPAWTAQGAYIPVSLAIRNEGSAPLTSFDIAYTVNSGDEQNISVTNINVAPFTSYTYTFQASPEGLGENVVDITVSNPNNADMAIENNTASCTTMVYDPALYAPKRVALLEHFTTARCPNCPPAHETLEEAVAPIEENVAWVAHHVGYYTDNMTISESNEMMVFYNDNGSTYAPAVMIDRNNEFATSDAPGPIFFPSAGYVDQQLENAAFTPANVSVNISDINYNEMTRELSVKVSGTFFSDITFGSARVSLYVTQDSIMGSQSGAQGTYRHDHVIRACISDVWGDQNVITTSTANSTFEKTFTYQLPYNINAQKARLVAFVNNYASNVNDRKVYNATKSEYLLNHTDPTLGINSVEASINVVTYPNPATEMAYVTAEGTIRAYEMVDALGRKVMSQENVNADILELNVSSFSAGVYFISITTDKGVATQRLTIVK